MPVVTFKFDLNFNQTINCVGNFERKKSNKELTLIEHIQISLFILHVEQ